VEKTTELLDRLRGEIQKAVVGQHKIIDQVLCAFLASGHVLVEGVPGLGKTLLVLSLARTFGGSFGRVQFTPDLMPSDVTGHAIFHANTGDFRIRKGPVFTNLLLADEINRAPAKTQAALLEVMQERQVSIEGHSHQLAPPFMTLATQNPIEQDGTYPLPEAQLDRFMFKIEIGYPEEEHEFDIVEEVTRGRVGDSFKVDQVEQVMTLEQARDMQKMCAQVRVDRRIIEYGVRLVRSTRGWPGIRAGAGPRGAISLIRAARAVALLEGRDHVIPDDVKSVAMPALRHRILLTPEVEIDGISADEILRDILRKVEVPRT
jgi:MoxR-like ATPase